MEQVNSISLKTFVKSAKDYRKKKVVLTNFPAFMRDGVIYDEYVLEVGPKGGIKVRYDGNKSLTVPMQRFVSAFETGGEVILLPNYVPGDSSTIFPTTQQLPEFIKSYLKNLKTNEVKYKRAYENAVTKISKFNKILESYPEYTI